MIRALPGNHRRKTRAALIAVLAVLGLCGRLKADVITFTGNVAHDFPTSTSNSSSTGVSVIPGNPGSVAESAYIIKNGWTTGFLIESVRFSYDQKSDTLFVGVQTYSIAGDADGNGNPGVTSPQMAAAGGINLAHFGGDKSLTVAFAGASATGGPATPTFVAGIPADKLMGDTRNTNEFTVATYQNSSSGLAYSYGTILNNHVGALAVDPSASMPNFEFALTNFSKIPGFNPSNGFYVSLFLGSQRAIVVGKESIGRTKVPPLIPEPGGITANGGPVVPPVPPGLGPPNPVPEPASMALFIVGTLGLVVASRNRRARTLVRA